MAYDQVGFGIRNTQGGNRFYARHGADGSLLGQMVKDVRAAVDFLTCRTALRNNDTACSAHGHVVPVVPVVPVSMQLVLARGMVEKNIQCSDGITEKTDLLRKTKKRIQRRVYKAEIEKQTWTVLRRQM
jgi:hypothetical protein